MDPLEKLSKCLYNSTIIERKLYLFMSYSLFEREQQLMAARNLPAKVLQLSKTIFESYHQEKGEQG